MTAEHKIFWSKWQYFGITTISPLWFLFSAQFTGREKILTRPIRYLIWVIPAITLVLANTNELHGLIWKSVEVVNEGFSLGVYDHNIGFYIHTGYSYVLLFIGTVWLVKDLITGSKSRRFQTIVILFSIAISWTANLLYVLRLFPIRGFDITPLSFSFVALVFFWAISRYQIFDLIPIAKDALLNSMMEGVIVIDPQDKILEINPAALEIIEYSEPDPRGRTIWELLEQYQEAIEPYRDRTDFQAELVLPTDPPRTIELQVTSIEQEGQEETGQLIVIRDITHRKAAEQLAQEQREFVEALADTASVINSTLDKDEVLEKVLANVARVVPHDSASVALVTEKGRAEFVRMKNPRRFQSMEALVEQDINVLEIDTFKEMARTRKPLLIKDTLNHPGWKKDLGGGTTWIRSYLGVPILRNSTLLGFLSLDSAEPGFFSQKDAERLEIFADYAATALTNADLYAESKYYGEEMAILYEISIAIAAGVGLEKTTQAVFRQLKRVIPVDLFYLALYDPEEKFVSYFMYDRSGERIEIEPFYLLQRPSITRYVMEKRQTTYIPDFNSPKNPVKEEDIIRVPGHNNLTYLGIPLILRGEVIGVLSVQSQKPNAYDPGHIRLIETIAQQATIAMDNAKLFERMQKMAITDSLTGLFNRRYFYMILNNEIERARRYASDLSLVMMDIDLFKRVNDKFGHLAGDHVLHEVAEICMPILRQSDVMFRYGGEEFMILLPETTKEEAAKVAERIRQSIAETDFNTRNGIIKITASIGVTEYSPDFSAANTFIESADKALYRAKEMGRNKVQLYSPGD